MAKLFSVYSVCGICLLLFSLTTTAAVPDGSDEITSLVTVRWSAAHNLANSQTRFDNLRLQNRSAMTIAGPIGVVVSLTSPGDAQLVNGTGSMGGASYLELLASGESLSPGATTSASSLLFANPGKKRIKFQALPYGKLMASAAPIGGQINATGMVKVTLSKPKFNRKTNRYQAKVKLSNLSASTLYPPLSLAFAEIVPGTANLLDPAGQLSDGKPYAALDLPTGELAPKKNLPSITLNFSNPERAAMAVTTVLYASVNSPIRGALFDAPNVWNQRVDSAAIHPSSSQMLSALQTAGGWGSGRMRIDFSMNVLAATASTPFRSFTPNANFSPPDCDQINFPLPAGGAVEGEDSYACSQGGDCHLLVVDAAGGKLYEMNSANVTGNVFSGGCAVAWNLHSSYPAALRGEQCFSTDAAGLPVAALLFSADEIAAGSIDHAIRFLLPNVRMRAGVYVHPATHAGAPSGGIDALPYGSRLRLRADYPLDSLPSPVRIIAQAMQRYGMILADGGNIALTARNDRFTQHKWSEFGIDSYALQALNVGDFEVVDTGPTITLTNDCQRNSQ